jgi:hypothetical protein
LKGHGFSRAEEAENEDAALQVAEKYQSASRSRHEHTAGAEAHIDDATLAARLKSCPDTELTRIPVEAGFSAACKAALFQSR